MFKFEHFVLDVMNFSEERKFTFDQEYKLKTSQLPELLDIARELQIVPENVFRYLAMKYKPLPMADGVKFEAKCIQTASPRLVTFGISELHKVLTDVNYVSRFVNFDEEITLRFNEIRLEYPDRVLYSLWLKTKGVELALRGQKLPTWEYILGIKKRAIKRKWCRLYMMKGLLTFRQFRDIMNNTDFSAESIANLKERFNLPDVWTLLDS